MTSRSLGPYQVYPIGYGAMPLSIPGERMPSESEAIATIHAALRAGVTLIDTADIYAPSWDTMGHNEKLVAKALADYDTDENIVVATKGGITRGPGDTWGRDGSAAYLRAALDSSLRNLGVDSIDLYQLHRHDPDTDYAMSIEALASFQQEGLIKSIGISNADVNQIRTAREVLGDDGLVSVQNEFSPNMRESQEIIELCDAFNVSFLPWSPFGGVTNASTWASQESVFAKVATTRGVSVYQVILAWELSQAENVIPIPGARRAESIEDSAKAPELTLTPEELALLEGSR